VQLTPLRGLCDEGVSKDGFHFTYTEAVHHPALSSNRIIQKVDLKKTVTKGSQAVRLSAATVSERWTRPAFALQTSKDGFTKAVHNAKEPLPRGNTEIAMR